MKTLTIVIALLITQLSIAQESDNLGKMILKGREGIKEAINTEDFNLLMSQRDYFLELLKTNETAEMVHYYIGYTDYEIGIRYLFQQNKKSAKKHIYEGIEHLEKAIKLKDDFAEAYALLSLLLVYKIDNLSILSAFSSHSKAKKYIEKALELEPENPRVLFIAGYITYYTKEVYGGDKEKGLKYFQKSVDAFETYNPPQRFYPDWGIVRANYHLGFSNMELGNLDEAQKCFEKVLEMSPDNFFAQVALADLEKKKAGKKGE